MGIHILCFAVKQVNCYSPRDISIKK